MKKLILIAMIFTMAQIHASGNLKDPNELSRQRLEVARIHAYDDYVRYRKWMGRATIVNALFTAASLCCLAQAHSVVQRAQTQQLNDSIFCPQQPNRQTTQSSDQR